MTPSRLRDVRHLRLELPRTDTVVEHSHRTHQLLRVERGALSFTHERSSWVIPTGGAVWLPAGLVHGLAALEDSSVAALYIRPRKGDAQIRPGPVEMPPLLGALMERLARPVPDPARRAALEAVVRDELVDVVPRSFVVAVPTDAAARSVALAVLADPADDRTLDELASEANAAVRTLQRRFSSETGLSFQTWRRRARLHHAMTLLGADHNVTETAHRCGFTSASAFIAAFRGELGVTPNAWRTAARGSGDATIGSGGAPASN